MKVLYWGGALAAAKRLYRIYYNTYDDSVHSRVIEALEREFDGRVVDHPSKVVPEFRFVELLVDRPGLEERIRELVSSIAGSNVKVDWIDTSS